MKSQLRPCPSCARHARIVETVCPFCHAALPDSFGLAPFPDRSGRLLSRAALFALGASLMGAPACDGDAKGTDASTMDSKGSGGSGGGGTGGGTDASVDRGSGGNADGNGGSDGGGDSGGSGGSDAAGDGADSAVDRGGPVVIYGAASAPR
ncbi:MAG TPA: hypothetical protein VFH73_22235 [Polyangia bacterium]|jgi:hypothetical protein|nr:hypothetical protein [Polyangia bacterium]